MVERNLPVTEGELHVYVDGELPEERRQAVENWLASHPEDAARVAAWRAQADAIRAHYGAVAKEPVPDRLTLDRITRRRRSWAAVAMAASLAAFVVGGVTGWVARGASAAAPSAFEMFAADALGAHRLYIAEVRHPIEVTATESHLGPWLSRRLGTSFRAPDLQAFGLKLLGGRLLPGPNGPAALYMYEGSTGERYTLYASKLPGPRTALHYRTADRFAAAHWVEGEIGYVLSGPADKERLGQVAQVIYEQLEQQRAPSRERTDIDQLISRRGS
jgi:anti-sigma factor RsiW